MTRLDRLLWALVAVLAFAFGASGAQAGCGCDHPPPAFAPVMPPFAAAGTMLSLHVEDGNLTPGKSYKVDFRPLDAVGAMVDGYAAAADTLEVVAPNIYYPGPTEIEVWDKSQQVALFDDSLFTNLTLPHRMPAKDGVILIEDFHAAVSTDGVMFIALDLRDVRDGTQFAFVMPESPVAFEPGDVVFYNREGVDLTLFTLGVADPTVRQWGSYYGWDVDEDGGIISTVYETRVGASPAPGSQSDMLTYWRHEFHTYADAHAAGGSHEVVEGGFHPNGTRHIDHDSLVIAVRGSMAGAALAPGRLATNLLVTTVASEGPIEPSSMAEAAYGSTLYTESDATFDAWKAGSKDADSVTLEANGLIEPVAVDESYPTATTDLEITKADYRSGRIKVFATSDRSDLEPMLSIEGHVSDAAMSWNAKRERYEYTAHSNSNLNGAIAVIRLPSGATVSRSID